MHGNVWVMFKRINEIMRKEKELSENFNIKLESSRSNGSWYLRCSFFHSSFKKEEL